MFQKSCKWFLKYLKRIHLRYEHFITHLECQAHKYEQNQRRTTDTDYEHINTIRSCRG